jgi:mRNA interferase MazF
LVNRGEVWWAELPGHAGRPYLILTRDAAIPLLTRVTAVPATRTIRGIRSEVSLGPEDGMPDHCVLAFDNIRTVRKVRLTRRITRLRPDRMAEVCRALSYATACG